MTLAIEDILGREHLRYLMANVPGDDLGKADCLSILYAFDTNCFIQPSCITTACAKPFPYEGKVPEERGRMGCLTPTLVTLSLLFFSTTPTALDDLGKSFSSAKSRP